MTTPAQCTAARLLLEQVWQAKEAGHFARAVELATQALDLAREDGDVVACGHSLVFLATMHWRHGRFEQAYTSACTAYGLTIAAGDAIVRLKALATCAMVRASIGDTACAIDILRQALRSVNDRDAPGLRSMMLTNLAEQLIEHGEHQQAIECLVQSVSLAERGAERPNQPTYCASELARAHVRYADHLTRSGCAAEARAQLRHAANVLPPLDASAWCSFSYLEYSSLQAQVEVCSALGDAARARRAAVAQLRFARQIAPSPQSRVEPVVTLSQLYWRCGNPQRAIAHGLRALSLWQALHDEHESLRVMRTLAMMYAQSGRYAEALQLRRAMMASVVLRQAESSAMSRRLAVIEREVDAQLADAHEKIAHAQQLSIIGRLIGQIHHALQAPIQRTRQLCVLALRAHERAAAVGAPAPGIPSMLAAISQSVDEAANLSRQLKIYAYRSSPITTTVSIHAALREVWHTLRPHVSERMRELRVIGDTGLHVRADSQRLGVLLTLMLIELVKRQPSHAASAVVTAAVETSDCGNVTLVLDADGESEATECDPSATALTETLCKALAAEMDATLTCTHRGGSLLRCVVLMPNAQTSVVRVR
jgi:tetratricopeptide (TPR) repeat protein